MKNEVKSNMTGTVGWHSACPSLLHDATATQ